MGPAQLGLGQNNLTEEVVLSHARAGCSTPKCSPGRSDGRTSERAGLAAVLMLVGVTGSTAVGAPLPGLDDPPSHTSTPRIPQVRTEPVDLTLNSTGTRRRWEAARGIGDEADVDLVAAMS